MSGTTIVMRAGWGGATLSGASDSLRARVAAADAQLAREDAKLAREREILRSQWQEDAIVGSIRAAIERGETVDMHAAIRDGGVGRTRAEALAYYSAVGDLEDAREAARLRKQFHGWAPDAVSDALSADTSAHISVERGAARAAEAAGRDAHHRGRALERRRWETVQSARRLAAQDRRADGRF